MTVDRAVLFFAGFMVRLTLSTYWFLLTAFVGLNMMQASITGLCPAAMIFKKLGLRPGVAFR